MSIDTDIEVSSSDGLYDDFVNWALENRLWNGKIVTHENAEELRNDIERKITSLLQVDDSIAFEKVALSLALLGSEVEERASILDDLQKVSTLNRHIEPVGFRKSAKKIWKKHKTKIIIGIVVVTAITVAIVLSVSGAGIGALGAAALNELDKPPPSPPIPSIKQENETPSLTSLVPTPPVFFKEEGMMVSDKFYTYQDALSFEYREDFLASFREPPTFEPPTFEPPTFEPPNSFSDIPTFLPEVPTYEKDYPNLYHKPPTIPNDLPRPPQPKEPLQEELSFEQFICQWNRDLITGKSCPEFPPIIPPKPSCEIGGINGINNSVEQARDHARYINEMLTKKEINWLYSPTKGAIKDVINFLILDDIKKPDETSTALRKRWERFHFKYIGNPNMKYLQICHSHGSALTKKALLEASEQVRDRVIVVSIAPCVIITKDLCYRPFNYVSKKDIVHYGEVLREFLKQEKVLEALIKHQDSDLIKMLKDRKEIIFLDPHPEAKGIDHDFQSPTYKKRLEKIIDDYIKKNGEYK